MKNETLVAARSDPALHSIVSMAQQATGLSSSMDDGEWPPGSESWEALPPECKTLLCQVYMRAHELTQEQKARWEPRFQLMRHEYDRDQ